MTIFIGRNIEKSSKIWLKQQRVEYIEQTLIDIQLNEPDYTFFRKIEKLQKHWIITSQWAAKWLHLNYSKLGFQAVDSVCCISEKQAEIVREFSDFVFVSDDKNAKSLSHVLHEKNGLKIFLKGNRSLEAFGMEIVEVDVYQNTLVKPSVENDFDAYLFFSPSGIESFIEGGNRIPAQSNIIVIGETTACKAKAKFNNEVIVSEEQSELAMLKKAVSALKEKEINLV